MRERRGAEILRSVAANVRRIRERQGLSQEALAEQADLDVRAVQRVEQGKINFGVVVLVLLAAALGVSPARLLRPATLERRLRGRPLTKAPAARRRG